MAQVTKKPLPPLILGIVNAPLLAARRYPESLWECGGAELRADGLPAAEVLPAVRVFAAEKRRRNFPGITVFTLRLRRDGGAWEDARSKEREPLWRSLAAEAVAPVDFVDLEIQEASGAPGEIRDALRRAGIRVLLSHHAFVPEKSEVWEQKLADMRTFNPDAVKFAVWPGDRAEAAALMRFARRVSAKFPLSCVLGMGEAGRPTRLAAPLLGCPIAYAFLEEGPVAPGQISADALRHFFREAAGSPLPSQSEEAWLDWAVQAMEKPHAA